MVLRVALALLCARAGAEDTFETARDRVAGRLPIRVGVFAPLTGRDGVTPLPGVVRSAELASVVKIAIEHFNARNGTIVDEFATLPAVCDDVTLTFAGFWNTGGTPNLALPTFLEQDLQNDIDSIIGPAWSRVSAPFSQIAGVFKIPVTSYASSAPSLDDREIYKYFTRTIPSDASIAIAFRDGCHVNQWTNVGIISYPDEYGRGFAEALVRTLNEVDESVVSLKYRRIGTQVAYVNEEEVASSVREGLNRLRKNRIFFFVPGSLEMIFEVARVAIEMGLVGPEYSWTMPLEAEEYVLDANLENPGLASDFFRGVGFLGANGRAPGPRWDRLDAVFRQQNASDHATLFENAGEPPGNWPPPSQDVYDVGLTDAGLSSSGFIYDAVANVGLAVCDIRKCPSLDTDLEACPILLDTIRAAATFEGVSGTMDMDIISGSRVGESANYLLKNARPIPGFDRPNRTAGAEIVVSGIWDVTTGWTIGGSDTDCLIADDSGRCTHSDDLGLKEFLFYDGTSDPPSDGIIDDCPLGKYIVGENACADCPAGRSQPNPKNNGGLQSCQACNSSAFAPPGSAGCTRCPRNTHIWDAKADNQSDTGHSSDDIGDCICNRGYYATEWPIEKQCRGCPENANCAGGLTGPYPNEGYWLSPDPVETWVKAYRCRYNWICKGGDGAATCQEKWFYGRGNEESCVDHKGRTIDLQNTNHWCHQGWNVESPMCAGEVRGYWYLDAQAIKCPNGEKRNTEAFVFSAAMFILVLFLFFVINNLIRPFYPVFDAVLLTYQDIGLITLFWFDWNERLSRVFFVFRVALLDVDVYEPTCAIEWGFNEAFRMMLLLPILMAGVNACGYACKLQSRDEGISNSLSFFINAQASLLYYCSSVFSCRNIHPANKKYYVEELDASCTTTSTTVMRVISSLYLLLIAAVTTLIFRRLAQAAARDELNSQTVLERYGFMYKSFRMGALWWGVLRLAKQACLVLIVTIAWRSPEDQTLWTVIVLASYGMAAAWYRPDTDKTVNKCELAGVGLSLIVVCLGLMFTSHREGHVKNDPTDYRYVAYFAAAQGIYFVGACVATGRNIVAVRARLAVAKRIGALHGRVVASQMSGKIGRARRTRGLTALEMELADSGDGTPLDRSDSEHAGAAARELRSPSSEHSSATQKLRMKLARKHRSLTDVEASQVERHASFIEKQHGHCEVLNTFTGPALVSYATDMRTLVRIVALDKVVGTAIEDMSAVGNFSQRHEAFFFNQLGLALPGLLDYALYADRDARRQLARTLSNLAAFDQTRRAAGAAPVADALIEAIDVPALIQWSVYAEEYELCVLRVVIDGMILVNPRLLAQQEAVRARLRVAQRVQRAWRRYAGLGSTSTHGSGRKAVGLRPPAYGVADVVDRPPAYDIADVVDSWHEQKTPDENFSE